MRKHQLKEFEYLRRVAPARPLPVDFAEFREAVATGKVEQYRHSIMELDIEGDLDWWLAMWDLIAECLEANRKHKYILDLGWQLANEALDSLLRSYSQTSRSIERLRASACTDADLDLSMDEMFEAQLDILKQDVNLRIMLTGFANLLWPKADLGWLRAIA